MGVELSITLTGDEKFAMEIRETGKRAENMSPVLRAIGEKWLDWNWEQFITQGGRASGGWAPLAASTVESKARQGLNPMILQAHERLIEAMTEPKSYTVINDNFLFWRLDEDVEDYAQYHATGTSKMPARPPLEWTVTDIAVMMGMLEGYLKTGRTNFMLWSDFGV